MARALTTKAVEAMKADPARRQELPDPSLSKLYLLIQPSGAKSWALRYRFGGKPKKLTLGKWPLMGVADARVAAAEAIDAIEHGRDPSAEKKATNAARLEAQLSERDKVKTLIGQYDKRHLSTLKSGRTIRRELDRHVVAQWGERDIFDLTKRDVIELLDGIADSGRVVTANRVRAYLNKFLNWCIERDVLALNPATGVKPVAKEVSRDRVLSDDEIRWLWRACDDLGFPWGSLTQTLLLTGQRLGEVAGMRDAEINNATWHLDATRTKNGRAHDVPLSGAVHDLLAFAIRIKSKAGLIFTTTGETPISGFYRGRQHVAKKMEEIAAKETGEIIEIPHWTFHDLRRTAATGMARLGVPVRVTEAVLNHVSGTGGGIVAVYQRHDYANEKCRALAAWASLIDDIVKGSSPNVVRIGGKNGF